MEILPRVKIQYPMKNRYKYRRGDVWCQNFSMNRPINTICQGRMLLKASRALVLAQNGAGKGYQQAYLIFTCAVSVTMICGLSR